jgi:Type II secretory pathway, pseudopilin PulG
MATGELKFKPLKEQSGFTYLAILFAIAIAGVVLAATGINWSHAGQREKEQELLFVGNQFRQAIALYYEKSPGTVKRYPRTLSDLLKDERQLGIQRYLRKVYIDPMTLKAEWGTVAAPDGGIMGVYSLSDIVPLKSANFDYADRTFEGAAKYADWVFAYSPQAMIQNQPKK